VERNTEHFSVTHSKTFKQQMLSWANQFNICCFLDNNQYTDKHHSYEWLLSAGAQTYFSPPKNILDALKLFYETHNDWLFGHFGYDLKNEIEELSSSNTDNIKFSEIFLFQPQTVILARGSDVTISCLHDNPSVIFKAIQSAATNNINQPAPGIKIQARLSKEEYLHIVSLLQQHILRGDCYEINYCIEFFAEEATVNPLNIYTHLSNISPNPFSCYYKCNDKYLFCASPERYMKKQGNTIISQPVKGTIRRNNFDKHADENYKMHLQNSSKDRSENVMVVDLVRNDLSKICREGSVHTEELFGVYTFPQVHQMISTVEGELKENINLADILKATFPMGSMTGAPKKRVMELIEQYEQTKRGIFSGAVGYITPEKDFDFNVVIRSIMYNATKKYLSYRVGSGITFYSDAEEEYEECLLKAKAIEKVLR
jgi:para-aminobenzoate synthetase component 1